MAHNNTVLAQLLNRIDRHDFRELENEQLKPNRRCRVLNRCGQFTTMLFALMKGNTLSLLVLFEKTYCDFERTIKAFDKHD